MRAFLKTLLTFSILIVAINAREIKSLADAINVSGKQRMFTQRILKDYAMLGLGVTFGNPKDDLEYSIKQFESNLKSLQDFVKDKEIQKELYQEKKLWIKVKSLLTQKPSKENAINLQEKLDKLLKIADNSTKLLAEKSPKKSGDIINISGRQRMLSQRMASLYILKVWGVNNSEFKNKMDSAMKLFEDSLKKLKNAKSNTQEISDFLNKVEKDFYFLKIMNSSSENFAPALIYKKSNEILGNMDVVTKLYASRKN